MAAWLLHRSPCAERQSCQRVSSSPAENLSSLLAWSPAAMWERQPRVQPPAPPSRPEPSCSLHAQGAQLRPVLACMSPACLALTQAASTGSGAARQRMAAMWGTMALLVEWGARCCYDQLPSAVSGAAPATRGDTHPRHWQCSPHPAPTPVSCPWGDLTSPHLLPAGLLPGCLGWGLWPEGPLPTPLPISEPARIQAPAGSNL